MEDRRVGAGPNDSAGSHHVVVLPVDPIFGSNRRVREQLTKRDDVVDLRDTCEIERLDLEDLPGRAELGCTASRRSRILGLRSSNRFGRATVRQSTLRQPWAAVPALSFSAMLRVARGVARFAVSESIGLNWDS